MKIDLDHTPSKEDIESVYQGLLKYNRSRLPDVGEKPIGCFIRDDEGNIIAGLTGTFYKSGLFIKYLWVSEQCRGQGYGRELLSIAETEARKSSINTIFLDTFTFQAPGFYEKYGFKETGRYQNFPVMGVDRIFLHQDFTQLISCRVIQPLWVFKLKRID